MPGFVESLNTVFASWKYITSHTFIYCCDRRLNVLRLAFFRLPRLTFSWEYSRCITFLWDSLEEFWRRYLKASSSGSYFGLWVTSQPCCPCLNLSAKDLGNCRAVAEYDTKITICISLVVVYRRVLSAPSYVVFDEIIRRNILEYAEMEFGFWRASFSINECWWFWGFSSVRGNVLFSRKYTSPLACSKVCRYLLGIGPVFPSGYGDCPRHSRYYNGGTEFSKFFFIHYGTQFG